MSARFDQFVEQVTSPEQQGKDYSDALNEWQENLNILYKDIESYLKPYLDSKKITITRKDKQISEEELGLYTVQAATIAIGSHRIHLDPIGTFLIAAKGRVDMSGPRGTVRLVLVNEDASGPRIRTFITVGDEKPPASSSVQKWVWKIATEPPDIKYLDLNETVFQDAMLSVANV